MLIAAACAACMFIAASWTSPAQSQSPATTATGAETPVAAALAPVAPEPAMVAQAEPAPADPAAQAEPAQSEPAPEESSEDVPEVVVDFPETEETEGDTSDDGEIELVDPTPDPTPTPAPTPSPGPSDQSVAPAPVIVDPGPTAAEEAAAERRAEERREAAEEAKADKEAAEEAEDNSVLPIPAPPIPPVEPPSDAGGDDAGAAGDKDLPEALKKLEPYEPAAHAEDIVAVTAGGVATIAALAAGLGAGGAGGGGGGGGSRGGGGGTGAAAAASGSGSSGGDEGDGYLEDVELERLEGVLPGMGWGDRSRTWGWRTTPLVDRLSTAGPARLATVSPVLARVSIDGDYLRAIFGGLYLLLFPVAAVLGVLAAGTTEGAALPPTLGFFIAILALSIFDSMVGYTAGIAFATSLLLGGYIDDAASVRLVAGLVLIWFAVPLAAAAVRPMRRNLDLRITGLWDRTADFVIAGLFGGWIASNQVYSLGPLRGYELPIVDSRWTIALIVIGLVGIRVITETAATHLYPERLEAVAAEGELESPWLQQAISLVIQMLVLGFVSLSFLDFGWMLVVGVLVFFSPLIPWLFSDKLPYSAFVAKWMPAGLVKWTFVIVGSALLGILLDQLTSDPKQWIQWSFIILPLPLLLCWAMELFAENEPEEEEEEDEEGESEDEEEGRFPMSWPLRLAGVPVLGLCVYTVLFVIG